MKSSTKSHLISILMILFLTTGIISSCKTDDESDKTEETTNTSRFTISSISGNTGEDGTTATFTMNLKTEPNGDVVIDVVSSDTGEGTVSPASLTFTAADYNIDQTADVSGVDDLVADSNQDYTIQLSINSANTTDTTGYASLDPDDVSVTNIDNDTAGFTILSISGSTAEDGTTATFTVRLNTQPVGDVVIDVVSSDTGEGTVSPPSLTFTTSTWNDDQTVTVTGISDATDDGDQSYSIQLTINSETIDLIK